MAKPLQGCEMSVVNYISVSVLLCRCQAVQLNKWVLRLELYNCSDWRFLIFSGSRFHACGAATVKERSPKSVSVRTTTRSPRMDDRSPLLPLRADTGWQKSTRCKTTLSLVDEQTRVCIVSSVQQATNEADHTAHDWCDPTYSVHRLR